MNNVLRGGLLVVALGAAACSKTSSATPAASSTPPASSAPATSSVAVPAKLTAPITVRPVEQDYLPAGPTTLGTVVALHTKTVDQTGAALGEGGFTCVVVATEPDALYCVGVTAMGDGDVSSEGLIPRAAFETQSAHYDTAVTGGTGTYAGLRGVFHWTQLPQGQPGAEGVFEPA